jgi:hypothetical protein
VNTEGMSTETRSQALLIVRSPPDSEHPIGKLPEICFTPQQSRCVPLL